MSRDAIFVDTSALFAVLDADDAAHDAAGGAWERWIDGRTSLVTSNYVIVEATALVRSRLGMAAVGDLHGAMVPMLELEWVSRAVHERALNVLLGADRRRLSLVDCTSFELMEALGLRTAFCFDQHFSERGFVCVP